MEVDELVKSMLTKLPKNNSEALRVYTMNMSILERLNAVEESHQDSEDFLIGSLPKSFNNLNKLVRSLKQSNMIINQSDSALDKLFQNLGKSGS